MRGSLGVIDALHEELQTATDDSSNVAFTTPYYSYLVKRLPLENGASKTDRDLTNLETSRKVAADASASTGTKLKEDEVAIEEEEEEELEEVREEGEMEEGEMEEEEEEGKKEEEAEKTPVRSKWWLWTSGSRA